MTKKIQLALACNIASFLFFFGSAFSSQAAVIISEVLPDPIGPDSENEFIEIFNDGTESVDIGGWKLDDIIGGGSSPKTIAQGTIIQPGQYLAFFASVTHLAFNNTTDSANLINASGTVVDSTSYIGDDTGGKVKENWSWALINKQWQWATPPTPNQPNSNSQAQEPPTAQTSSSSQTTSSAAQNQTPTSQTSQINYLRNIFLNEILPNPVGADATLEFIELYNGNTYAVDLGGWKLDDAPGGSSPYTIPASTTISALGYFVFYSEDTRIALNNNGDETRLFFPDGKPADSIKYADSQEGLSYAKTENETWSWTTTLTPGQANVITAKQIAQSESKIQPAQVFQQSSSSKKTATQKTTPVTIKEQPTASGAAPQLKNLGGQAASTTTTNPEIVLASAQPLPLNQFNNQNIPSKNQSNQLKLIIDFKSALLISLALAGCAVVIKRSLKFKNQSGK